MQTNSDLLAKARPYHPEVCAIHMLHEREVYLGVVNFPTDKPGWVKVLPWSPEVEQCVLYLPASSINRIESPAPDRYIRGGLGLKG